ncbi:cupin domain-containing protein [Chitinophaga caseinilytica]|uniref:Cupin domain-containing protein n=1 Tax=Chitinophaga caseinilytica TaxID=2267521 RepID=A0ABZ2Z4X7_9BACT
MELTATSGFRRYQGGFYRTLIHPEQTNGDIALLEFTLPAGGEPPLHVHYEEDESFVVLEGRIRLQVGDVITELGPGDAAFAPRKTPHAFNILTPAAKLLNLITPGKLSGFFEEFSTPLEGEPAIAPPQAPDMEAIGKMLQTITQRYNVHFLETK